MNAIDIIIIAVIGLSTLFGLYRGFIQSVLNLGSGLVSVWGSFWLFPRLSDILSSNTAFTRFISTYTDSGSILGNLDLSSLTVNALSEQSILQIVEKANLPEPIGTLLAHNLAQQVFAPLGSLATNVGDYLNQTVISVSVNVLCFLLCFVICFAVSHIVINMLRAIFNYPVLKHFDGILGGAFGFLQGVLLCFVIFTLLPLAESLLPLEDFRLLVDQSQLAQFFKNGNLIISIMNRKL